MVPIFETERFIMCEMIVDDVDDMYHYYSNADMMKFTSTDIHRSKDETLSRIKKLSLSFTNEKGVAWAIEEKATSRVIGDIGSERVMEKAGMMFEGTLCEYSYKDGYYYDVKMFSIIRSDIKDEKDEMPSFDYRAAGER